MEGHVDHQNHHGGNKSEVFAQKNSILIDLGACCNYISPRTVGICKLNKTKHKILRMIQLATGSKRNVS